jgi:hypothetical protein
MKVGNYMLYDNNGYQRVTIVDGEDYTGLLANDGSYNGVLTTDSSYYGLYHPCGAYNVTEVTEQPTTVLPSLSPLGTKYVANLDSGYVTYTDGITIPEDEEE